VGLVEKGGSFGVNLESLIVTKGDFVRDALLPNYFGGGLVIFGEKNHI